ncbi:hypothetical protein PG993_013785 [Apiospora rasikravindrae]|uniref:Uncharacterized protein n=1 Tax=Apiospora rasikravindrae TaxID=990691 RepID=A0ABR1RR61_9PEZI
MNTTVNSSPLWAWALLRVRLMTSTYLSFDNMILRHPPNALRRNGITRYRRIRDVVCWVAAGSRVCKDEYRTGRRGSQNLFLPLSEVTADKNQLLDSSKLCATIYLIRRTYRAPFDLFLLRPASITWASGLLFLSAATLDWNIYDAKTPIAIHPGFFAWAHFG